MVVVLSRTSKGFLFATRNNEHVQFSSEIISKSQCMSTSFETCGVGDNLSLAMSEAMLLKWHCYVGNSGTHDGDAGSTPSLDVLLHVVQAADFLDDNATLAQASCELARLAFPTSTSHTPHAAAPEKDVRDTAQAAQDSQKAARALQVVEALPEHLTLLTLRAALAAVPPDVRRHIENEIIITPTTHLHRAAAVRALMALLPPQLHHLVIIAANPDERDRRALELALPDVFEAELLSRTAAVVAAAVAAAGPGGLTSLRLAHTSWGWVDSAEDTRRVRAKTERVTTKRVLPRIVAPVSSLASLLDLSVHLVEIADFEGCIWAHACGLSLGGVLRQLPQLTSLRLRNIHVNLDKVVPHLTVLRALKALDLGDNRLQTFKCDDSHIASLVAALCELTTLTHLCLSHNEVGRGGDYSDRSVWEDLEPVIAQLPLLSLELESCDLGDGVTLGVPGPPGPGSGAKRKSTAQLCPLSSLRRLRLSGNRFKHSSFPFLSHMPHLTEVSLGKSAFSFTADAYRRVLDRLHAPDLEVLELPDCPAEWRRPQHPNPAGMTAVEDALSSCMLRCPMLRAVAAPELPLVVVAKMLSSLEGHPHLRELDLGGMRFQEGQGERRQEGVAAALAACCRVTALTLCGMLAPDSPLWGAIASLTALQQLKLAGASKPKVHLRGGALARLSLLTRLHLQNWHVRPEGVGVGLADALKCMPAMREIEMHWVRMDIEAFRAVLGALSGMGALSMLHLELKSTTREPGDAVVRVLPTLRALRVLRLFVFGKSHVKREIKREITDEVVRGAIPGLEHLLFG